MPAFRLRNSLTRPRPGPAQIGNFTSPLSQGLSLGGRQSAFNLGGTQAEGGPNVNLGGASGFGAPSTGPVSIDINRQASSDPVQRIINDIGNPLSGTTVGISGGQGLQAQPQPQPNAAGQLGIDPVQIWNQILNRPQGQGFLPPSPGTSGNPGMLANIGGSPQLSPGQLKTQMITQNLRNNPNLIPLLFL